jgi:hypothetical protein
MAVIPSAAAMNAAKSTTQNNVEHERPAMISPPDVRRFE